MNAITNTEEAKVWKEITDFVNARAGGQKKIGRANQGQVPVLRQSWRLQ